MRRSSSIPWLAFALAFPGMAGAAELEVAIDAVTQYNTNVLTTNEGEQDDFSLRAGPELTLRGDRASALQYSLRVRPTYEVFLDLPDIDTWEHYVNGDVSYRLGDSTEIYAEDQFQRLESLTSRSEFLAQDPDVVGQPETILGRETVDLNYASVGLRHSFTPRVIGELGFSNSLYLPSNEDVSDASTSSGHASFTYALSRLDRLGWGVQATNQDFGDTDLSDGSVTRFYELFGLWERQLSPTWSLNLRAGPTLVKPESQTLEAPTSDFSRYPLLRDFSTGELFFVDADSCPEEQTFVVFTAACQQVSTPVTDAQRLLLSLDVPGPLPLRTAVQEIGGTEVTYFAQMSLTKRWRRADAALSYRRSAGTSSSLSTSTVVDTLELRSSWRPTERWSFFGTLSYNLQGQSSKQPRNFVVLARLDDMPDPMTIDSTLLLGGVPGNAAKQVGIAALEVDNAIDVRVFNFYVRAERRMTKRSTLYAAFVYIDQTSNSDLLGSGIDFQGFRVQLGYRYAWEPIPL